MKVLDRVLLPINNECAVQEKKIFRSVISLILFLAQDPTFGFPR
jgi:hypothetical protein